MAITKTLRLALNHWGLGTDPLARSQVNDDHDALDLLAAIDVQGTLAARPAAAAANRGEYYYATDVPALYRSTGSAWVTLWRGTAVPPIGAEGTVPVSRAADPSGIAWEIPEPPGVIKMYGGAAAPTGYLLCNGAAVSRTTYAALFAILGTAYGNGDGTTTFNLPDLRQRFPLGKAAAGTGAALGAAGGAIDHRHTQPQHHHTPNWATVLNDTLNNADAFSGHHHVEHDGGATNPPDAGAALGTAVGSNAWIQTGDAGADDTGTNNPPFQVVNFIVKV